MSTTMLFSRYGVDILAAIPALSGTPAPSPSGLLRNTDTTTFSISGSSLVTRVPGLSLKLESTRTGTLYFFANSTERVFAPCAQARQFELSSYDILSSFRACGTMFGSVVYTRPRPCRCRRRPPSAPPQTATAERFGARRGPASSHRPTR